MITFAAWVLAGIALWFTRSVLDMFGDGQQSTRVAMLPSMAELAGLIVLSLLLGAAIASMIRRWDGSRDREMARLQIALPLLGLVIVVLPYLPWLPDWVLPLRAVAGPMTMVVWIVVGGQLITTALSLRPAAYTPKPSYGAAVAIFLVTFAVAGAAGWKLRNSLTYPSGDEPHHMIMMQSLWGDHDLQLQNNYDRLDYEEYFPSSLAPAPAPPAAGLAILGAPVFAWGGYHGVIWMQVLLAAMTAAIMWRWTLAYTGSAEAATMAWAAVFLGAPLLLTSFAIYPEIPAAFCVMVALAWRSRPQRADTPVEFVIRGLAVSALPWFALAYAPLAAALIVVLGLRGRARPRPLAAVLSIFTLSLIGSTLATRGGSSQPELGNPITGMVGLLFDQEFGVLPYAPALAIGLVNVWRMAVARDHLTRRHGRELAMLFLALLVAAGSLEMWWGGAAPPGRMLVPVLPALGLPIAWAYRRGFESPVRRSGYQLLVFVGIALSSAMVLAQDGGLITQDRDGSARVLQWLTELWPAWEAVPSIAAFGLRQSAPLVALWIAAAAAVAWLCGRPSKPAPGIAALLATGCVSAGVLAVGCVGPAIARPRFAWVLEPESRSRVPMLDDFDAIARPHAIVYDPFTFTRATSVPPLMSLSAFPGQRPAGQPVRVLLNARYALPAGEYEVEIGGLPAGAGTIGGVVGLQVGRIGPPLHTWDVALSEGSLWRSVFTLPVDAEFVGFVALPPLDAATSLRVRPRRIENRSRRQAIFHGARPLTILSAIELPAASVFFHDEEVYPEHAGFWIRGGSTAVMTIAPRHPENGVIVRVHSGARPNTLTLVTTTWGDQVSLVPGAAREIRIPPPPQPGPFVLRVTAARGFAPADVIPGSADRRILGGWMEVTN